jgi:hypothetical protein
MDLVLGRGALQLHLSHQCAAIETARRRDRDEGPRGRPEYGVCTAGETAWRRDRDEGPRGRPEYGVCTAGETAWRRDRDEGPRGRPEYGASAAIVTAWRRDRDEGPRGRPECSVENWCASFGDLIDRNIISEPVCPYTVQKEKFFWCPGPLPFPKQGALSMEPGGIDDSGMRRAPRDTQPNIAAPRE